MMKFKLSLIIAFVFAIQNISISQTNIDFETGNLNGWTGNIGANMNSNNSFTSCLTTVNQPLNGTNLNMIPKSYFSMMTTAAPNDPYGGFSMTSPLGGSDVIRLGNENTNVNEGGDCTTPKNCAGTGPAYCSTICGTPVGSGYIESPAEAIEQTFAVTSANALFTYAWAAVLNDGNHLAGEQPYFEVKMYNQAGAEITCFRNRIVQNKQTLTPGWTKSGVQNCWYVPNPPGDPQKDVYYRGWTTVNALLANYIGQNVKVRFAVAGCVDGGHFGYAYFDAKTAPAAILISNAAPCPGQTVTLSAPAGVSGAYTWSGPGIVSGAGTATITVNASGTYSLTVPTGTCTATMTASVTYGAGSISVTSGAGTNLCNGQSTVLTASGVTNYTWSANAGSATTNTVSVTPGVGTTNYTVTGDNGSGCPSTQTISVVVSAQPTVSISGTLSHCTGSAVVLTGATTAGTFTWSANAGGASTSTVSVNPGVGTTTYTLSGSNGTCTASTTVTMTTVATPTLGINGTTSLCSGQSTVLTATTAATYTWSANAGSATTSTVSVTPGVGTTVYTVTGDNGGGCTAVKTVTVTVTAQPTVNISGTLSNCSGTPVVLTGATATNYTWLPGGANTSTLSVNPAAGTTTYTLTGANGSCTASAVATVTTTATPTLTVNSPSICSGQSAILTAATANSYSWSTTATTNTISVSPVVTTTYNVTGDNGSGCTSTKTATVTVNTTPTVSINGASTVCSGNAIVLTAATAANYTWSANAGSATTNTVSVTPGTGTTTYTLTGANGACTATAAITVTATPSPTLTVNSATICSGQSVVLTAATANTYSWSTTATTNTISVSPAVTTTYNVTGDNGGGCTTTKTATVTVNPTPTVAITGQHTICSGVTLILTGATATSYTWLPGGANTPTLSITPPNGSNTYTLIGANGACTATTTASVDVSPSPTVTVNNATICAGETATLTAGGAGTYSWSANAGGVISPSVSVSPSTTTVYTVGGIIGSCVDSTTATVTVAPNPTLTISGNTSICPGSSLVLTGGTATTYTWSSNAGSANTNTVNVTPTTNTTYTLTGTSGSCTASIVATVTVNTPPTIGTSTVIDAACGQSNGCIDTVLVSGGAPSYQYSWDNGTTWSNAASNCNVAAGNYTVQVKDANGCGDTATVSVGNLNGPSAPSVAVSTASVCAGSTVSLSINSPSVGITYTWTDATGTHTGTTYTITNIAPAGNYSVSVTATDNGTSCISAATTTVIVVNAMPVVTATAFPTSICSGQSTTLTASGAPSYTWSSNAGSATTNTVSVSPTGNTTYTVTGDNSGCTSVQTISVGVTPTPTISVNPSSICAGQTTTLTASGATNYTWTPGGITTNTISVTANTTQTYVVTGDDLGCTSTQTVTVTVTPNPTVTVVASQSVLCAGQTTTLTAGGATTYTWSPGGPGGTISVSPAGNTTYTVTGANGTCVSTETVVVNVNPSPTVSIVPSATAICSGNTATFTASGATNYTWQPGGSTSGTFTDNPTANTTYTLIGESGGCSDSSTVTLSVNTTPTLSVIGNQAVCAGGTVNGITYSSGGATVNWTNTNGNIGVPTSGSGNIGSYTAPSSTVTETGVITATAVDPGTGCIGNSQTYTITIYPAPIVNPGTIDTAKCGIMNGGVNGVTVSGGTSPIHYQWYDSTAIMTNDTLSTLSGVGPGTYSVLVTDANGCIGTGAGTVPYVVPSITTPTLNITPALTQGTAPVSVTFTANASAGVTTYNWNLGDGTISSLPGPSNTYTNAGTYSVILTVSNGSCLNRDTAIVIVDAPVLIIVPNIYSPNGDGINDEFFITTVGIQKLHCDIFNRWGQLVYQMFAIDDKWDGVMINGNDATDGTYFYILDATGFDGKQYKSHGSLTLVR